MLAHALARSLSAAIVARGIAGLAGSAQADYQSAPASPVNIGLQKMDARFRRLPNP